MIHDELNIVMLNHEYSNNRVGFIRRLLQCYHRLDWRTWSNCSMDWDGDDSFDQCMQSVSGCKGGSPCPRPLLSNAFANTLFTLSLISISFSSDLRIRLPSLGLSVKQSFHGGSQTTTSLLPAKSHAEMRI
jgi:hypothetical protein